MSSPPDGNTYIDFAGRDGEGGDKSPVPMKSPRGGTTLKSPRGSSSETKKKSWQVRSSFSSRTTARVYGSRRLSCRAVVRGDMFDRDREDARIFCAEYMTGDTDDLGGRGFGKAHSGR